MKKFVLTLTILVSNAIVFAQKAPITQFRHFKIDNNDLIYQRVVDTTVSATDALKYLRSLSGTRKVQLVDDFITAEFENVPVDIRRIGRNWLFVPGVITDYNISGKLTVELREGRYRITLSGMFLVAITDAARKFGEETFADRMLKPNKTSIRPAMAEDALGIYDLFFTDYFLIKSTSVTTSEW
ncbi:MAG TPA: hypothetical protein VEB86_05925 [Chryseosolibacter sp.]|nr:hypothetical protein [Chryseosolibacter sp.]